MATYYPIPHSGEVDLFSPLLASPIFQSRFDLCLPVVTERGLPLTFRRYGPGDLLQPSLASSKLLEPSDPRKDVVPRVMLVPLLAFSPCSLYRLGYGGGYYDKTIQSLERERGDLVTIGVGLECLRHEGLPVEQGND